MQSPEPTYQASHLKTRLKKLQDHCQRLWRPSLEAPAPLLSRSALPPSHSWRLQASGPGFPVAMMRRTPTPPHLFLFWAGHPRGRSRTICLAGVRGEPDWLGSSPSFSPRLLGPALCFGAWKEQATLRHFVPLPITSSHRFLSRHLTTSYRVITPLPRAGGSVSSQAFFLQTLSTSNLHSLPLRSFSLITFSFILSSVWPAFEGREMKLERSNQESCLSEKATKWMNAFNQ